MKYENEITVEVNTDLDSLLELIKSKGFLLKEEYDLNDIYFLKKDVDKNGDPKEILNNCVLIRNIIDEEKSIKRITYKYKEYNEKNEITKQGKADCTITNIDEAITLLECIGYKKLINVNDHLLVYANETTEFAIQLVNDKHIYIEMEEQCNYIDRHYESVEEMISDIKRYDIPIKDNNYFVKKAEIELLESLVD